MKNKERPPQSWAPVRRGSIYCSTACGHQCTWHEYRQAVGISKLVCGMMKTKGWVPKVWENLGWYWCLENELCGMSLHVSGNTVEQFNFWCMMADAPVTNVSYGSTYLTQMKSFKNPNRAVAAMFHQADAFFNSRRLAYQNLLKIKS